MTSETYLNCKTTPGYYFITEGQTSNSKCGRWANALYKISHLFNVINVYYLQESISLELKVWDAVTFALNLCPS